MPATLTNGDLVTVATIAAAALRPAAGRDWSARAGSLDWTVAQTVTHMTGAVAKYTLQVASRSEHFLALTVTRWPDATNSELIDAIVPVARGLAAVAAACPPGVRAFHVTGPSGPADFVGRACAELLVHTGDAAAGLGVAFEPPDDLCRRVLAQQYPGAAAAPGSWHGLLAAAGRPAPRE